MSDLSIDIKVKNELPQHLANVRNRVARGMYLTMQDMEGYSKQVLRDDVRRAGLGERLANTWRFKIYPDKGRKTDTLSPALYIYSNAPVIVGAFSTGVTIRRDGGFWLAIPLSGKGRGKTSGGVRVGRGIKFTPLYAEARYDQDLIILPTKNPNVKLAVVDSKFKSKLSKWRRKGGSSENRPERDKKNYKPLFVLIRQVRLRRRLNTYSLLRRLEARFTNQAAQNLLRSLKT